DGAPGCAVEVLILAALQRPEERREPGKTKRQRERDEDDEDLHQLLSRLKAASAAASRVQLLAAFAVAPARRARSAFSMTRMDEPDIAAAAIKGVTTPLIAIGTARQL